MSGMNLHQQKEKQGIFPISSWERLEAFWRANGGRVKKSVLSALTATFLMTSAACSSPTEKKEAKEAQLPVLIENFEATRDDALAAEELYYQAEEEGDAVSMRTQKKQMDLLRAETIKKAEQIEALKQEITKYTLEERKADEKLAKQQKKTITREEALQYTP